MKLAMSALPLLVSALLVFSTFDRSANAQTSVVVQPYPTNPTVMPYPDGSPPADLPKDSKGQQLSGDAKFSATVGSGPQGGPAFSGTVAGDGTVKITVTEVDATATAGATVIRVPQSENNANSSLLKHELGHHQLCIAHRPRWSG